MPRPPREWCRDCGSVHRYPDVCYPMLVSLRVEVGPYAYGTTRLVDTADKRYAARLAIHRERRAIRARHPGMPFSIEATDMRPDKPAEAP